VTESTEVVGLALLNKACRDVGRAAVQLVVEAVGRALETYRAFVNSLNFRPVAIEMHGPRNLDRADDTWQSDMCAGWLHDSCPAPQFCDCTCHGGTRR